MDSTKVSNKDSIVRKIRRFPQGERRYIIGAAIQDLDRDLSRPLGPDRYQALKTLAENAAGQQMTATRCRNNTDIRMMIAKQMRTEGYTVEEIGHWMGRDHSTVTYYARTMDDALSMPGPFAELITKYETFIKLIQDYDR